MCNKEEISMILPSKLVQLGFALAAVNDEDYHDYFAVKKACYSTYVDEYFGGWIDEIQREMNAAQFQQAKMRSCFAKILLHGKTVGFFSYNEHEDKVDGISIQMLKQARNHGLGSFYLKHILSKNKQIELTVFKSNPAKELYARHGFVIYDETASHYFMRTCG